MNKATILAAATALLAACSSLVPLSQVDAAEARWKAQGISNYAFIVRVEAMMPFTECSAGRRVDVEVRNGKTVKFGTCAVDSEPARDLGSVPQIFVTIRANRLQRPPRYLVQFNPSLGYPEHIDVNLSRTRTDHGFAYYIEGFREIE